MSVALLVMTDGRDELLAEAIGSAHAMLTTPGVCAASPRGHFDHLVLHDDTGNADHHAKLAEWLPQFTLIGADERLGFGGAVRNAWAHLRVLDVEWVFWLEDDFKLTRPVHLEALMAVMSEHRYLAQMALMRQPWNETERLAGGILEQHPGAWYVDRVGDYAWREHRLFFTTNPCLVRRSLLDREWPEGPESEGRFGIDLFANGVMACAFWGAEGEWCEHIGHERVGVGY